MPPPGIVPHHIALRRLKFAVQLLLWALFSSRKRRANQQREQNCCPMQGLLLTFLLNGRVSESSTQKKTPERRPKGLPSRGIFILCSVVQLESKLDLPRIVRSIAVDPTSPKMRIVEVARAPNRYDPVPTEVRRVEVRVVEDIEELSPELHRETIVQLQGLEHRVIQTMESRSKGFTATRRANAAAPCRGTHPVGEFGIGPVAPNLQGCAKAEALLIQNGLLIPPFAAIALFWIPSCWLCPATRIVLQFCSGSGSGRATEVDRLAALKRGNPVDRPPAPTLHWLVLSG